MIQCYKTLQNLDVPLLHRKNPKRKARPFLKRGKKTPLYTFDDNDYLVKKEKKV